MTNHAYKKFTNQLKDIHFIFKPKIGLKVSCMLFTGLLSNPVYSDDFYEKLTEFYKQEISEAKFLQYVMEYYHVNQFFPAWLYDRTIFSNEIDCKERRHGFTKNESCNDAAYRLWGITAQGWFCIETRRNTFDPLAKGFKYDCATTDANKPTAFQRWAIKKVSDYRSTLVARAQQQDIRRNRALAERLEQQTKQLQTIPQPEVTLPDNNDRIKEIARLLKFGKLTIKQRIALTNELKSLSK